MTFIRFYFGVFRLKRLIFALSFNAGVIANVFVGNNTIIKIYAYADT